MSSPAKAKLVDQEKDSHPEVVMNKQKPPFTFEWVEVSSGGDVTPEPPVTGAEYPAVEVNADVETVSTPAAADPDSVYYYTFSPDNPRFSTIISSSHLAPRYNLAIPAKVGNGLPQKMVPAVLDSYGKRWTVLYNGHLKLKSFDRGWKQFVDENGLKLRDCCHFEVTENSKTRVVFKVIILRTALYASGSRDEPPSDGNGDTPEEPILVD